MRVERCAKTRLCTAWGPAKSLGFILTAVKSHGGTRIRRGNAMIDILRPSFGLKQRIDSKRGRRKTET